MRELTMNEMALVSGAGDSCGDGGGGTPADTDGSPNTSNEIVDTKKIGDDIINVYEGIVQATSHVIERVADSF